jgi:hypothetical protein
MPPTDYGPAAKKKELKIWNTNTHQRLKFILKEGSHGGGLEPVIASRTPTAWRYVDMLLTRDTRWAREIVSPINAPGDKDRLQVRTKAS